MELRQICRKARPLRRAFLCLSMLLLGHRFQANPLPAFLEHRFGARGSHVAAADGADSLEGMKIAVRLGYLYLRSTPSTRPWMAT
jgi:hypothetical protein